MEVSLDPHQVEAWNSETRFDVRVWARRSGKTYFTILRMLVRASQTQVSDWQAFYIAPTRLQAKQIAWPYLTQFSAPLGAELNIAEMKCTLPNGAFIQLMNGEQYNRMRGLYADDVTIDEAADVPENAWNEVISPMLSDRQGRLTVMGTPRGRLNLLYKLYEYAGSDDPEWSRSLLNWEQAGRVDPKEIERNRRLQTEAQFAQEWECSWDGSTPGAYFGKEMSEAEEQGRVTTIRYDDSLPVVAALDLGHHDLMPVVWSQKVGTETRILGCRTYQFTSIPDMVKDWKTLPYAADRVVLPHDAKVTDLTSGKTRQQTFHDLGVKTTIAPKIGLDEGIEQTRQLIKNCWFDRDETRFLREGLAQYRSEYDELRGVHRLTPIHDQASHYADAFRYLATGRPNLNSHTRPRPRFAGAI